MNLPELANKMRLPVEQDSQGFKGVVDEDVNGIKAIPYVLVTKNNDGEFEYAKAGGGGTSGPVSSADITDATTVGKAVLTAADAAAARTAIGAGTSSLTIGTTASAAAAGNHTHTIANITGLQTALDAKMTATKAAAQVDSVATDVAGLVVDFNALLAKLRTAGILTP